MSTHQNRLSYRILGSLEVSRSGAVVDVGPKQQRALLALLVMNINAVVRTERILDALWPSDPVGKERTLWVYISRLRSILEPDRQAHGTNAVLVTRDHGYSLISEPDLIDSYQFEQAASEGRRRMEEDPAGASRVLGVALDLWRGSAFEDFVYDEFAQLEIARLEQLRVEVTEDRLDADLRCGRHQEVIGQLEQLVRAQPLRERPVELLMIGLYRSGRQAEALRAFEKHRELMASELGLEPSRELTNLEEQILLHDERLEPAHPSASDDADRVNPFKGLHAFSEADVEVFFGRDGLTADLVQRIGDGRRLLALVGASGSGKSSVLKAGLIPELRKGGVDGSERWLVAQMVPGSRPFTELEAALLRCTPDAPDEFADLRNGSDDGLLRACLRLLTGGVGRVVLVIDQFEELFTLVESEDVRACFIRNLEAALDDPHGRVLVLLALRADFYARPLEYASFGRLLGDGVVNTTPLTPDELEAAAEAPAARAGVSLEPALLARLITDVVGQSGGLPLFQYTLTELFDRRNGDLLTSGAYEQMGGVKGALGQRAEAIYSNLDATQRETSKQLFLRLVAIADSGAWSRRRLTASDVKSLDAKVFALQQVLDRFGGFRLLTFDRDQVSGSPTVEVAHEALLHEWERLRGWIDECRDDVMRYARFTAAIDEWSNSGETSDYLLTGQRLIDYEDWADSSALKLTARERSYIEESAARRDDEQLAEAERLARETKVSRQARRRLQVLFAGGLAAVAAVVVMVFAFFVNRPPQIAVVHGPAGDLSINDLMASGVAAAEREFDIEIDQVTPLVDHEEEIRHLAESGADLIVVSSDFDLQVEQVAPDFPDVHFVAVDPFAIHVELENITEVQFAVEESAYLAGAAAAFTTRANRVGFIGAAPLPSTEAARAGFEAGARAWGPDIEIVSRYIGPVSNPLAAAPLRSDLAQALAEEIYALDVDVIFNVAGSAGAGVVAAARELSTPERHLWVIGSDADEYDISSPVDQRHLLSSSIKRYNAAVLESVRSFLSGELEPGTSILGLGHGAVELSRSGDHLTEFDGQLKNLADELEFGHINVSGNVSTGPGWQDDPDVVIELTMDATRCSPRMVRGEALDAKNEVLVAPGSVVHFEYANTSEFSGGVIIRTVSTGVTLDQLLVESVDGIPASLEDVLGASLVDPGGRTRVAIVMVGARVVPNCVIWEPPDASTDLPAMVLVPSG